MSKNPLVNALAAVFYIAIVSLVMNYGSKYADDVNPILAPIAFMSIFTLSAAVMGYLFLYQPIQLYFGNKKKEAIDLFLKTVVIFAGITIICFAMMFTGVFGRY